MEPDRPQFSAVFDLIGDLRKAIGGLSETHKKMFQVTGVAWSDDRTIKAVVGPRGHLIELDIDPRVYRKPNSKLLSATIVDTVRKAVEQAMAKTEEIMEESLPKDVRLSKVGDLPMADFNRTHDADLAKKLEGDDELR